jgi:hypothetical protein
MVCDDSEEVPYEQNFVSGEPFVLNSFPWSKLKSTIFIHKQLRNNLTYWLNSMEQSPSWEANISLAIQQISRISGTQVFLTMFTSACHLSLSWARLIQFMPFHPFSFRICFNIFLPSVSRLPKWFCPTLQRALSTSLSLIWLPYQYLERSANYETLDYLVFFQPFSLFICGQMGKNYATISNVGI